MSDSIRPPAVAGAALVQFDARAGRGAIIRNSTFTDSYNNLGRVAAPDMRVEFNNVTRCGDGAHVEFLPGFLEGSLDIRNITVADNTFVDVRSCGGARKGTEACGHVCDRNVSCVLAHVGPGLRGQVHASGNVMRAS